MPRLQFTVGSTSRHKIQAVRGACSQLGLDYYTVTGIKTDSGQNEQPVGFAETLDGALARALAVKEKRPDRIAIGIESGIFVTILGPPLNRITLDIAVIVVITKDNRQIITTSAGLVFPEDCVQAAKRCGFETTTVGSVITEKFGGDPTDPHSTLTQGKVSRLDLLTGALVAAICQL